MAPIDGDGQHVRHRGCHTAISNPRQGRRPPGVPACCCARFYRPRLSFAGAVAPGLRAAAFARGRSLPGAGSTAPGSGACSRGRRAEVAGAAGVAGVVGGPAGRGCRGLPRGGACRIRRPVPPGSPGAGATALGAGPFGSRGLPGAGPAEGRCLPPAASAPGPPGAGPAEGRGLPGPPGGRDLPRPPAASALGPPGAGPAASANRACRGRRARPPKKICKKLDKPLQGGYFPPQVTHRFSNKGGNAGRKKGLKTRSPVAQSRNLAYIRYGSLRVARG